jgi:hypothetical protein
MIVRTKPKWVERQIELSEYVGKRKYCSQMTAEEMNIIWNKFSRVEDWGISTHALDRLAKKGIKATYEDIVSMIGNSEIVEYKIDYEKKINRCEERVVLVSNAIVNGCYRLKAVFNFGRQDIVTVWINHINDNHATLDWSLYDADMKVFGDI